MRHMITALFALGLSFAAQAFPLASTDPANVELNVWNSNVAAAKAKARALNRPVLLAMGDSVNCGYTKAWGSNILASPEWTAFIAENPLVLVLADKTFLPSTTWYDIIAPYRSPPFTGTFLFPTMVLFRPDGTVADQFLARSVLGASPGFYNRVRNTTDQYPNTGTPPPPASTAPAFVAPTPGSGATVSAVLNSAVNIQASATGSPPIAYSATGLPAGLSINAATGLISGTPTVAGNSAVTVNASNSKGSATIAFTLRVAAPATITAGSYQGFFYDPDLQTVRGTLTLSANATGALKALAVLDGQSFTFTGTRQAGAAFTADLQSPKSVDLLSVQVDDLGILTGTLGDADLFGRLVDLAGVGEFAGYYTSIIGTKAVTPNSTEIDNQPEGSGNVTFTVTSRGAVSYKGVLADGTLFSGSSTLVTYSGTELADLGYTDVADDQRYALFTVYNPLYLRRGVVAAQIWIDGNLTPTSEDNKVFIVGSEWVYPGKSATADADGFTATLDEGAFTEIGAAFVKPANLAVAYDGTSLQTDGGAVPVLPNGLSIKLQSGNALKATLTASTTTGLISGKILYSPDSGAAPYVVSYSGVLVPSLGIGAGYYLVTDNSVPGYSVKRSKTIVIAP